MLIHSLVCFESRGSRRWRCDLGMGTVMPQCLDWIMQGRTVAHACEEHAYGDERNTRT